MIIAIPCNKDIPSTLEPIQQHYSNVRTFQQHCCSNIPCWNVLGLRSYSQYSQRVEAEGKKKTTAPPWIRLRTQHIPTSLIWSKVILRLISNGMTTPFGIRHVSSTTAGSCASPGRSAQKLYLYAFGMLPCTMMNNRIGTPRQAQITRTYGGRAPRTSGFSYITGGNGSVIKSVF